MHHKYVAVYIPYGDGQVLMFKSAKPHSDKSELLGAKVPHSRAWCLDPLPFIVSTKQNPTTITRYDNCMALHVFQ